MPLIFPLIRKNTHSEKRRPVVYGSTHIFIRLSSQKTSQKSTQIAQISHKISSTFKKRKAKIKAQTFLAQTEGTSQESNCRWRGQTDESTKSKFSWKFCFCKTNATSEERRCSSSNNYAAANKRKKSFFCEFYSAGGNPKVTPNRSCSSLNISESASQLRLPWGDT